MGRGRAIVLKTDLSVENTKMPIEEYPPGTALPPACRTCEHHGRRATYCGSEMVCLHPQAASLRGDVVHGWRNVRERDCEEMRKPEKPCGPEGRLWEPRRSSMTRWLDWYGGR
jgi:hypothetical protein